jgi:hypothetical protein
VPGGFDSYLFRHLEASIHRIDSVTVYSMGLLPIPFPILLNFYSANCWAVPYSRKFMDLISSQGVATPQEPNHNHIFERVRFRLQADLSYFNFRPIKSPLHSGLRASTNLFLAKSRLHNQNKLYLTPILRLHRCPVKTETHPESRKPWKATR